jgi:hypothetical protein
VTRAKTAGLAAVAALLAATGVAASDDWPRLVGTAPGAAGGGLAVFEDPAGRQAVRRVGSDVAGLRLVAIRRGEVDLTDERGGRVTLRLRGGPLAPRAGPASAARPPRSGEPPGFPTAEEEGPFLQSAKPIAAGPVAPAP